MRNATADWPQALRALLKSPGAALSVVLTLGLGIGIASSTGVVSRAIAFAGLPVPQADRVLAMWGADRAGSFPHMPLAPRDLPALAESMRGVATIAAGDYHGAHAWLFHPAAAGAAPLRLRGTLAGGDYFAVLGTPPLLGRALGPDDDVVGAARVMVLAHSAWQRHFGGDRAVVGRALRSVVWGEPFTIVGVMPPGLDVPRGVEFWTAFVPTAARNGSLDESPYAVDLMARLAPGASAEQARERLTAFYARLAQQGQAHWQGARATVRTLPELVSGDVRPAFLLLTGAALVVLLATCANVAGLLLVQATARRRDLAVRMALGAARGRLVRALLVEHAALAAAGGALGALLASLVVWRFVRVAPADLPRIADLGVDWRLYLAVLAVTGVVVLLVGVVPAVRATGVPPAVALGGAHEGAGGTSRDARLRRWLVSAQVAIAVAVLAGAALLLRGAASIMALESGLLDPAHLSFVELVPSFEFRELAEAPAGATAPDVAKRQRWWATQEAIVERVRQLPGVVAVAPVVAPPFSGTGGWDARIEPVEAAPEDSARRPYLNMEVTDAHYLRTMGLPLLQGRWLASTDRDDAPAVVALSQRAARALFPDGSALGARVKLWGDVVATVVGVVGDARFREYLDTRPSLYVPYRQFPVAASFLAVRAVGDAGGVLPMVRREVAAESPTLLVHGHGSMRDLAAAPLARPRLVSGVLALFALLVTALAVAGLYAVIAGSVLARRREFGVRAALGASPRALRRLVLRDGLRMVVLGIAGGLALVLPSGSLLSAAMQGVPTTDPVALALSVALLLGVCLLAVLVPAARAAAADPVREMRAE